MKYEKRLIIRILIAVILALLFKFYYIIFTPITLGIVGFFLKLFGYNAIMDFSLKKIIIGYNSLDFVEACIAGSAYFLFSLLVLFTKNLGLRKSLKLIGYGVLLIFSMNVLRIIILIIILLEMGKNWFDLIHLIFWWFVAGIYIAIVWIFLTKKFKIKTIPVYSDIKALLKKRKPH